MTYHRATDPVIVKGELVTFWQYWPEMTVGLVRHADGRFRSYNVSDIHKHLEISETTQIALNSIRDVFALPEAAE